MRHTDWLDNYWATVLLMDLEESLAVSAQGETSIGWRMSREALRIRMLKIYENPPDQETSILLRRKGLMTGLPQELYPEDPFIQGNRPIPDAGVVA